MISKSHIKKAIKPTFKYFSSLKNRIKVISKPKVFCVGANKTGTTSLKRAMEELGFVTGKQQQAVALIDDWALRSFDSLIKYCKSANFFQDIPFSLDYTFAVMDYAFKESKFILTVRESPEQWYDSVVRFETKLWGQDGNTPTKKNLQESTHISKGRLWEINRLIYKTPEDDLYNKNMMIQQYIRHNESIKNYFRHRSEDLLVLNVADKHSYGELCEFLGLEAKRNTFPWENKTSEL